MSRSDDPHPHRDCPGRPSDEAQAQDPGSPDATACRDEACPTHETAPDRRQFLGVGLAAGAVATGLLGCKKGADQPTRQAAKRRGMDSPAGTMAGATQDRPRPGAMESKERPRPAEMQAEAQGSGSGGARPAPSVGKSKVVQVINAKAYDAKGRPATKPVKEMVDTAVMVLTGKPTPKAAWSSLFKPADKVGLKPNCLGRQLCWPHPATVDAIIEGLLAAGVPYQNMYMWDMWGFPQSPLSRRYRKSPMKVKPIKAWGFSRQTYKIGSGPPVKLTKALLAVDAVVSIPVIKDHDLAAVTCALKNMAFGSIPNPWTYHANRQGERFCDPMVPEIYALPPIKDKVRLILADAFNIIIDGGPKGNPRGQRKLHSVFAAIDPVAMDRVAWTIIDGFRVQAKLPKLNEIPLTKNRPRRRPRHVLTAEKLGLGTADPRKIDHIVKTLG